MENPFKGLTAQQVYENRKLCPTCHQLATVVMDLTDDQDKKFNFPYFMCKKCKVAWEMSDYVLGYFIKEVLL